MDILYLLIPMSALLVLGLLVLFAWALHGGQFDDIDREGERILDPEPPRFDGDQAPPASPLQQSASTFTACSEDLP